MIADGTLPAGSGEGDPDVYSFAYVDEGTKRGIRRAILKAIAVPGYQVPFPSREMPLPPGWGTGGMQVTASLIGREDCLKVIDQGADDATNAISIRSFFRRTADVGTTSDTRAATIVQTRHRVPEEPLRAGQILVLQVPQPEPLRTLVPREPETRRLHGWEDYGVLFVKLFDDVARLGQVGTAYDYPVLVAGRYVASPSPVPKFDNPKLHRSPALALFGAGRERRVYAIPPHTPVESVTFEDHPFELQSWSALCARCGAGHTYLNELALDDRGGRAFLCSDTDYCERRRAAQAQDLQVARLDHELDPARGEARDGGHDRPACRVEIDVEGREDGAAADDPEPARIGMRAGAR